jgi:hypothetical protein
MTLTDHLENDKMSVIQLCNETAGELRNEGLSQGP